MNKFLMVYKWIIISITIQLIGLIWIENVVLTGNSNVIITPDVLTVAEMPDGSIKIPQNSINIKVTADGNFVAYTTDNNVEIKDLSKKKTIKIFDSKVENITYYRWVPEKHILIYAVKPLVEKIGQVQIFSFDADNEIEKEYPKLTWLKRDSEVQDIEVSPLTNTVYIKIKTNEKDAKIYRFNIMGDSNFVMNIPLNFTIKETNFLDKLIYSDINNKVMYRDGISGRIRAFNLKGKLKLLEIDSQDNIYIGELNKDNKIEKINYGKFSGTQIKTWSNLSLKMPIEQKQIFISEEGKIFQYNDNSGEITFLSDYKITNYDGEFIEIIGNTVISKDGQKLKFKELEK